jgi:hypothetical protein
LVFGAPNEFGFVRRIFAQDGVQEHVNRDVVGFVQFSFEAFAIAAIRVFKHSQFAFAIAAHDGDRVFDGQGFEIDSRDFLLTFFCQVALSARIDHLALQQKIATGIGVKNLSAIDSQLKYTGHWGATHLVDRPNVGHAILQRLADLGFFALGKSRLHQHTAEEGQQESWPMEVGGHGFP